MSIYLDESESTGDYCSMTLPCGNIGEFDWASGMGYRCTHCMAMFGSVSMPTECRALVEMDEIARKLKGKK